jgi:hypothetical protein
MARQDSMERSSHPKPGSTRHNSKVQPRLGPLVARNLILQNAAFVRPLIIEAAANHVDCRGATWKSGVTIRLRYARIDIKRASFTEPSFIVGAGHPFELTAGFGSLDERILRSSSSLHHLSSSWIPFITTQRGAKAAHLSFIDVDLSEYHHGARYILNLALTALEETINAIGRMIWALIKKAAEELAKYSMKPLFWAIVKYSPSIAVSLGAWLVAGRHWAYVAALATAVIALPLTFLARKQIADRLNLPIRVQYAASSGWSAVHGHTRLANNETRLAATRALMGLRSRLRKTERLARTSRAPQPSLNHVAQRPEMQRRVQAWAEYPATCPLRPPVLLDPPVLSATLPGRGADSSLPPSLMKLVRGLTAKILRIPSQDWAACLNAGPGKYEVSEATRILTTAFQHRYQQSPEDSQGPVSLVEWYRQRKEPPSESSAVIIVKRDTKQFLTDRGMRKLPAWQLKASGIPEPIWVLDPGIAQQFWRPATLQINDPS